MVQLDQLNQQGFNVLILVGSVDRVVQLDTVMEKTLYEWIPGNIVYLLERIQEFERWLGEQDEDVVAVVGHSQFFKYMLGLDFKFGNCSVWKVQLDTSKEEEEQTDGANDHDDTGGAGKGSDEDMDQKKNAKDGNISNNTGDERDGDYQLPRGWFGLEKLYEYKQSG